MRRRKFAVFDALIRSSGPVPWALVIGTDPASSRGRCIEETRASGEARVGNMASRTSQVVVNREGLVVDERLTKCLCHLSKAKPRSARCRGCQLVQGLIEIHLNGWEEKGSHVDILMRSTRGGTVPY